MAHSSPHRDLLDSTGLSPASLSLFESVTKGEGLSTPTRTSTSTESSNAHISTLRRHSNTLLPISRLPPDTLIRIFRQCPPQDGESDGLWKAPWIVFTHVCHYWRDVALTTPTLWNEVTLGPTDLLEELQAWLCRSGQALLTVIVKGRIQNGCFVDVPVPTLMRILDELPRIRNLSLIARSLESLRWSETAPSLQQLRLINTTFPPAHDGDRLRFLAETLHERFPALRLLDVNNYPFGLKTWVFPATLTCLKVHHRTLDSVTPLCDTLQALRQLPQLEELVLIHVVPRGCNSSANMERVSLHSLRYLRLVGSACEQFVLLGALDFPPSVRLNLELQLEGTFGRLLDVSWTSLSAHLSRVQRLQSMTIRVCGGILRGSDVISFNIRAWRDQEADDFMHLYTPHGEDDADINVSLVLDEPDDDFTEAELLDEGYLPVLFRPLLADFPLSDIRFLCLDCAHGPFLNVADAYRKMDKLQTLAIIGVGCEGTSLIDCLEQGSGPDNASDIFPSLRVISATAVNFDDIHSRFKTMLQERRNSLGAIKVILRSCFELKSSDIDAFKEVASIEWDGEEAQMTKFDQEHESDQEYEHEYEPGWEDGLVWVPNPYC